MPMIGGRAERTDIPDLVEPLVGLRAWNMYPPLPYRGSRSGPGPELYGPTTMEPWTDTMHARCTPPEWGEQNIQQSSHEAPGSTCSCGLYAFHSLRGVEGAYFYAPVVGIVQMWGVCEVHTDGIRSQYMRICALSRPPWNLEPHGSPLAWWHRRGFHAWYARLGELYGVPLIPYGALQPRMHEWGRPYHPSSVDL